MYYYLSFLRPPPTTVDLASPLASNGITITPQIANDLRTELLDDRATEIWYSWNQTSLPPSSTSGIASKPTVRKTPPARLTTYEPPSSTYKPIPVALPPNCRAGETWVLSLFSPPEGSFGGEHNSEGVIPLRKREIVGVQSMGIEFVSSSSMPNSSARAGPSSRPSNSKKNGKQGSLHSGGAEKSVNGKKSSGSKQVEGPKQTRIMRSWTLPSIATSDGLGGSSSFDGGVRVERDGFEEVDDEKSDLEDDSTVARVRGSIKRDSEGVPVVREPVVRTELDRRMEEEDLTMGPEKVDDRFDDVKEMTVHENRRLRVIEETSFDLDKKIWDSGLALTSYLLNLSSLESASPQKHLLPTSQPPADLMDRLSKLNSRILEIGAGTGLVGIGWAASGIASGRGSRVMITDLPSAIPLIDENIELNRDLWKAASEVSVHSGVLDWDEEVPDWVWECVGEQDDKARVGLDVVLAADVTYNTASFPALVNTLKRLFTPPSPSSEPPLLFLAYKQRHSSERTLWPALQEVGIELKRFGSIAGHEVDLEVDVVTGRDEEQGEEVRSGMGATELWIGRKRT